ncbi:uncharacterized protein LOC122724105 [Manihot esculenta]|uniref:RPW8 domain-containing protein n=1 Tax=Manihot esculenta TaxID=3983 RepID=A0A2C9VJ99_MANES|nr:uncharacterized protein LOC122724105 [Manihot esculenta]OAY45057.1 hypothetical protein MANES_07G027200v8 [Manihot esculenta]
MTTLGVAEIIAIAIASAALFYQVGKDALKSVKKEASYSKNLKENYEALQWELNFLLGFKSDIERTIRKRRGNYGEIYNRWSIHVHEVEEKAKSCLEKYEHIRKCYAVRRSKLSRKMVSLCKKVIELKGEGKDLARLLSK